MAIGGKLKSVLEEVVGVSSKVSVHRMVEAARGREGTDGI